MNDESEDIGESLAQWLSLADDLVAAASREQLELSARLLAMNLARYQARFGDLPPDDIEAQMVEGKLDDDTTRVVISGMGNLVGILGGLMQQDDEAGGAPH
jgi:hypothetical protein